MTGNDLFYWLNDIWYDLMNFGQADVFSLFWRLLLLFLVVRIVYCVLLSPLKKLTTGVRRGLLSFPRKIQKGRQRRKHEQNAQLWAKQEEEEQKKRAAEAEIEQKRVFEEREAIQKALDIDD